MHPIGVFAAHHFSLDVAVEVVLRPRGASIARVKAHKMEARLPIMLTTSPGFVLAYLTHECLRGVLSRQIAFRSVSFC